jgi:hypothetical protein
MANPSTKSKLPCSRVEVILLLKEKNGNCKKASDLNNSGANSEEPVFKEEHHMYSSAVDYLFFPDFS